MKKRYVCMVALLWWSICAHAAFDFPAYSARHAALSNSYLAATGRDGFLLNPALSANAAGFYAALNYSRLFNLAELRYANGIFSLPLRDWGVGASVESFGGNLYSETRITLNTARVMLADRLSAGFSGHLYRISVKNYESTGTIGFSVGLLYSLSEQWQIGAAIENINQPELNGYAEELPQAMRIGVAYQPVAALQAFLSVEKDRWYAPEVAVGVSYQISEQLAIQSGYNTQADKPSAGVQFSAMQLDIGYAMQYHFDLGETHFFSVAFHR